MRQNNVPTSPTSEVLNQAPALEDFNAFTSDRALCEALDREGGAWAVDRLQDFGALVGSHRVAELGRLANEHVPILRSHDRYGHRIDEVEYHPAYHEIMTLAMAAEVHSVAWTAPAGGHVVHAALGYLLSQTEAGSSCPLTMTYACVPTLRIQPEIAAEWEPRLLAPQYDPRFCPAGEKRSALIGMAMTEKQGGSDVRANTTRARVLGGGGPGAEYELCGHKWFCSAPMCDGFFTLAQAQGGLSCFFVPRWCPDGSRNRFLIQRLKDKLGNRSNASAEIEYDGTYARLVGEEGRGVATIIDMVHHTRIDCATGSAGIMRRALASALHHAAHRRAFGRRLIEQPLMANVLADLALESEAATALVMRVARAFDRRESDVSERLFGRIATAVAKYWVAKRTPAAVCEALECHGGNGYVEESLLPRLYREAPLNSIWEGSGNVQCLDVLRALRREPETAAAYRTEIERGRGADRRLDAALRTALERLHRQLRGAAPAEIEARALVENLALVLQGSLLVRHAPSAVADAFCASRFGGQRGTEYGTLASAIEPRPILDRAAPRLEA